MFLSELVPLTFALRSFFLRRGFWHGYMQGAVSVFFCGLEVFSEMPVGNGGMVEFEFKNYFFL